MFTLSLSNDLGAVIRAIFLERRNDERLEEAFLYLFIKPSFPLDQENLGEYLCSDLGRIADNLVRGLPRRAPKPSLLHYDELHSTALCRMSNVRPDPARLIAQPINVPGIIGGRNLFRIFGEKIPQSIY
ncbi:hypothetical protein [Permianibacter aggregans]|uniref:hypothetical protein n=1 Tax=Permianibacter aggregans TaxID=1510150 RepID=UPI00105BCACD|nr:hypothetical protein [Permianibacter aggregans]QGX41024.1 hypothetical protein E2H98_15675 [Permianibacter aggregans]